MTLSEPPRRTPAVRRPQAADAAHAAAGPAGPDGQRPRSFSIRRRVFAPALALLVGALVVLILLLRGYAHRAADEVFDRLLAASALTIAGSVQIEDDEVVVELPFASLAMLPDTERIFYVVRSATGELTTGYDDLATNLPLAQSARPVFSNLVFRDAPIRVATVGRLVSGIRDSGWITIRVAETRGARASLASEILQRSALPLVLLVLVALGLLWFGTRYALAPLATIELALRGRAPDDLTPLNTPVPDEIRSLVETLNVFMLRLDGTIDTLTHLVADAAHQVRTPLASLRAQAEVALEEQDPVRLRERIGRIHLNAAHASQLIHQLLMDATITHRLGAGAREAVGVAETVNATRRRIGPLDAQRLHIAIAPEVRRARVMGDQVALREMLKNLVDNALRYAPEGRVDIEVTPASGRRVALTVSDHGPGIPDGEKHRVQQRFQRGSAGRAQPGSGLGLAIVRAVAQAHGGELSLSDRPDGGLVARVVLPLSRPGVPGVFSWLLAPLALATALTVAWPGPLQAAPADAVPTTRFAAPRPSGQVLTIAGTTDAPAMAPLIRGFQAQRPELDVTYHEMGGRELYNAAVAGQLREADLLISSSVDSLVRLANDGFALSHASPHADRVPASAVWRREVFGFTFEPVVMIYNPRRFTADSAPRSRLELLRLLEREGASLQCRVGTYDIADSSLGYLLAVQDELVSSNFWGLMNALGQVRVHLSSTSAGILDAVENGSLDLGYNVLGSYALSRQAAGARIGVVFPHDYVLVLSRSALIPRQAPHPDAARAMVDWLLSPAGQQTAAQSAALGAISPGTPGPWTAEAVTARAKGVVQPVTLHPTLLVGLDPLRQARFVRNWRRLVSDAPLHSPDIPGATCPPRKPVE
jgi:two-component system sensor histidine kinase TctE